MTMYIPIQDMQFFFSFYLGTTLSESNYEVVGFFNHFCIDATNQKLVFVSEH